MRKNPYHDAKLSKCFLLFLVAMAGMGGSWTGHAFLDQTACRGGLGILASRRVHDCALLRSCLEGVLERPLPEWVRTP